LDVSGCWDACWQLTKAAASHQLQQHSSTADACITASSAVGSTTSTAGSSSGACQLPDLQELLMLLQDHAALSKVAASCPQLQVLHMSDGGHHIRCSMRSLTALQQLSGLTSLSISSLEKLRCIADVAQLSQLRHLKLFSSRGLKDDKALQLSTLSRLTCLDLRHSGVTAAAATRLASQLCDTWVRCE
jgi:hypothetical protein